MKFSKRAMDRAAAAGHLEMVKWLHGKDLECTTDAMDGAAEGGHLSVVEVGNHFIRSFFFSFSTLFPRHDRIVSSPLRGCWQTQPMRLSKCSTLDKFNCISTKKKHDGYGAALESKLTSLLSLDLSQFRGVLPDENDMTDNRQCKSQFRRKRCVSCHPLSSFMSVCFVYHSVFTACLVLVDSPMMTTAH